MKWRGWLDFGTGALGDMGCHILDPTFWALDLHYPESVEAWVENVKPELASQAFPISSKLTFEFPARGKMPPLKLVWRDGHFKTPRPTQLEADRRHARERRHPLREQRDGDPRFARRRGLWRDSRRADAGADRPPKTLPRIKGSHEQDWIRACKDGKPASSPFAYGGPLTELLLVGVIAIRLPGEKLQWNGAEMKFTNNDRANELIHPAYREGWSL